MSGSETAIQDRWPGHCFGCGRDNKHGLQIKSFVRGDRVVCDWTPQPYHCAGETILYGGIIASLIDCHSASAALCAGLREQGHELNGEPPFFYLTKNLNVTYLKPTPLPAPVHLEAWVEKLQGRGAQVICELSCEGEVCARGDSLFVRVPTRESAR